MFKKARLLLLSILSVISLATVAVASFAWFSIESAIPDINIDGLSDSAYFAYGDGSSSEPFGIKTPRQLYNLAWLQYNGMFNKDANSDGVIDKQFYFELANDLDMTGWELPPIGTEDNPFLGNFDGNSHVISNLIVSNKATFDRKPTAIDYNVQPEIVGFFGVVGDGAKDINYSYTSSINQLTDFTLNNLTVESKTSQTLIGLAAGYVNGDMSGVRIDGSATLDVNGQTSTAISSITSKLSDYGLVGFTTKTGATGSFNQKLSEYFSNNEDEGGGDEDDWGGSINPRMYSRLIYDHYKFTNSNGLEDTNMRKNTDYTIDSTPTGNYKLNFRMTTDRTTPYNATSYTYYMDPDYFNNPEDGHDVRTNRYCVLYHLRNNGYIPLRFSDSTNVDAHKKNTGYIVGSSSNNAGSPKVSSGYISNIVNAISNTSVTTTGNASNNYPNMTYTDSALEVITYSTALQNWYKVKDSHNSNHTSTNSTLTNLGLTDKTVTQLGFEKYEDSRNTLQNILETTPRLNALKFDNTVVSSSNLLNVTSGTIKVNSNTFVTSSSSPYQFPKGSIDFNLKKTGFINFFAGTYYYSATMNNFSFFTLNHIQRSGGTISSMKKIAEIYQNKYWSTSVASSSTTNPKFFYKYSDGSFSNIVVNNVTRAATLADRDTSKGNDGMLFNASYALESPIGTSNASLFKKAVNNLVFYFEVPVNDGEYAMGMAENPNPTTITSFTGAYMMYLDIGANGDTIDKDVVTAYSITTVKNSNSFPVGVDFKPITVSGNGGDTIAVSIDSSKKGVLTFVVSTSSISVTDSSSIAKYAYRNTNNYVESSPTASQFTCNLTGAPPSISTGGTRVLIISLTTTDDDEYVARITDSLNLNGTIASSTYELDSGSGFVSSTESAITSLSTEIHLTDLRGLFIAATLTRSSGNAEFATSYNTENCSYEDKTIDVSINKNGTSISIAVTSGYTFKIDGTPYSDGGSY